MINLKVADNITKDLLSRSQQDGGLSDKAFDIIANIGKKGKLILKEFTKVPNLARKHSYCDNVEIYRIYDANVVVCLKDHNYTVIQIRKA